MQQVESLAGYATIDGAARAVGVTYWTVANYIKSGKVPAFKLSSRAVLVRISDVRRVCKEAK